ncbi:Flavonol synthase/flavanone 3-hydroxylase [Acorus calamus]|uniref:Flavonol synthase/flavanone 3-hydroxylase n=1 Tax=Acorus calamus TaxID=4465 RepID=A0AAV9C2B3_ACOCL|nr:Flavonol synthase/flavanone 3-hydroxylase [Acorus calamus]
MASPPSILSVQPAGDPTGNKGAKHLVDTSRGGLREIPPAYILTVPSCRRPATPPSIPVIDLHGLHSPATRDLTVSSIAAACAEWGFFRVVNHGVRTSLMEDMLRSAEDFFNLPLEEKLTYSSDDVMHPVRYGTSLNTSASHTSHWRDYLRHFGHVGFDSWPQNPPNYRHVAREYLEEVRKVALGLAGAISEGLGLGRDHVEGALREGCQIMASNYYPPCPQPNLTMGLCPHSDHGGFTILTQNDVDGLWIRHVDEWVPVDHVTSTFVVNIGDYLEILSNGRYKSVEHMVLVNEHKTRISVAVGHGPHMEAILKPAENILSVDGCGPKYRPIVYKDYMKSQQSIVRRGKSALEQIMI